MNNNISDISIDSGISSDNSSKSHGKFYVQDNPSPKVIMPITQDELTQHDNPMQPPTDDPDLCVINTPLPEPTHAILHLPKKAVFKTPSQMVEITTDHSITYKNNDIDDSNAASVGGSSVAESESEEQVLLTFMSGAKKENGNLAFRTSIIMSFCPSKTKIKVEQFFPSFMHSNFLFDDLTKFFRKALTYRPSHFRSIECAEILLKLWHLVQIQDDRFKTMPDSFQKDSRPVAKIREYVNGCLTRISADSEYELKNKRKRNLYRQGKNNVQANVVSKEGNNWYKRIEPHPCPKCNHGNIVSLVPIETLVEEFSLLEMQYKEQMEEFNSDMYRATFKKDGGKRKHPTKTGDPPRKPSFPKQTMICMCSVSKCKNIVDGRGCHHCNSLSKSGIQIPFNITKAVCECALCKCDCDVQFSRSSWQSIAAQAEEEREIEYGAAMSKKQRSLSESKGNYLELQQTHYFHNTPYYTNFLCSLISNCFR